MKLNLISSRLQKLENENLKEEKEKELKKKLKSLIW